MTQRNNSKLNQIRSKYGYGKKNNQQERNIVKQGQRQNLSTSLFKNDRVKNSRKVLKDREEQDMKYRILSMFTNVKSPKSQQNPFQRIIQSKQSESNLTICLETFRQQPLTELQMFRNQSTMKLEHSFGKTQKESCDLLQNYRKKIRQSMQQQNNSNWNGTFKSQSKRQFSSDKPKPYDQNKTIYKKLSQQAKQVIRPKRCSPLQGIQLSTKSNIKEQINNINQLQKKIQSVLKGQTIR